MLKSLATKLSAALNEVVQTVPNWPMSRFCVMWYISVTMSLVGVHNKSAGRFIGRNFLNFG